MPQLDTLTFFSQFFWLCFFFLGFYLTLVKYFLPRMSKILKIRSLRMNSNTGTGGFFSEIQKENADLQKTRDQSLSTALKESRTFFNQSFITTNTWLSNVLQEINKNQFLEMNKNYITSISNLSTSQSLILNNLKVVLAPSAYKISQIVGSTKTNDKEASFKEKLFTGNLVENLTK
jgi:F0F1-type ATP synthase membrane subunit b/b'